MLKSIGLMKRQCGSVKRYDVRTIGSHNIHETRLKPQYRAFELLYQNAFPEMERRTLPQQLKLFENQPSYFCDQYYVDDQFIGFIAFWKMGSFVFIEHMAVSDELRSQGHGSNMLAELHQRMMLPIILEVEKPEEGDGAKRRIHFYIKNGFVENDQEYVQPAYDEDKSPVSMLLLSTIQLTVAQFDQFVSEIHEKVYGVK